MKSALQGLWITLLVNLFIFAFHEGCSANRFPVQQEDDPAASDVSEAKFSMDRERMVQDQLRTRDITDERVLAAMLRVPRHEFVPIDYAGSAYEDNALPLKIGQTISQPYIVAYMTQALELRGTERVLEIGTGSGYQTAVLAEIAREVYTVEILPQLQEQAVSTLSGLGYRNIKFRVGDGYMGWPDYAPFDCIIVTAAPDRVPQPLIDQLNEGGRLVIPLGTLDQELTIIVKTKSGITQRTGISVRFVPMTGKIQERR